MHTRPLICITPNGIRAVHASVTDTHSITPVLTLACSRTPSHMHVYAHSRTPPHTTHPCTAHAHIVPRPPRHSTCPPALTHRAPHMLADTHTCTPPHTRSHTYIHIHPPLSHTSYTRIPHMLTHVIHTCISPHTLAHTQHTCNPHTRACRHQTHKHLRSHVLARSIHTSQTGGNPSGGGQQMRPTVLPAGGPAQGSPLLTYKRRLRQPLRRAVVGIAGRNPILEVERTSSRRCLLTNPSPPLPDMLSFFLLS